MVSATLFVLHTNFNLGFKSHFAPRGSPLTRRWAFAPGENQRFAWVRAKSIQERPGAARTAQEQPRNSPWTPWKRQEQPGAARGNPGINQGRLGRARGSPGVPRSSQQTARSHQELPGAARSTQEPPGLGLESQGDPSQEATLRSQGLTL